jgi:succinyl-CoA synthetase beta subunit
MEAKMGLAKHDELLAFDRGINYVEIKGKGNIGIMVNGAGLAMATMDLLRLKQGMAANFMDISGKVDVEEIEFGF